MIHWLKTVCSCNLVVATMVVFGYCLFGLSFGLPIDESFLGIGPGYPVLSSPAIPAWALVLFVESVVVILLVFSRYAEQEMKGQRVFCGVVGSVGLAIIILTTLAQRATESSPASTPKLDWTLGWYVWCSHLIHAIVGTNED